MLFLKVLFESALNLYNFTEAHIICISSSHVAFMFENNVNILVLFLFLEIIFVGISVEFSLHNFKQLIY